MNGPLAPFFAIIEWCERANAVLDDPAAFRPLGAAANRLVRERYSLGVCLPRLRKLFRTVAAVPGEALAVARA